MLIAITLFMLVSLVPLSVAAQAPSPTGTKTTPSPLPSDAATAQAFELFSYQIVIAGIINHDGRAARTPVQAGILEILCGANLSSNYCEVVLKAGDFVGIGTQATGSLLVASNITLISRELPAQTQTGLVEGVQVGDDVHFEILFGTPAPFIHPGSYWNWDRITVDPIVNIERGLMRLIFTPSGQVSGEFAFIGSNNTPLITRTYEGRIDGQFITNTNQLIPMVYLPMLTS
ncbi:MAG: hypothetical protein AB4911_17990 [Oscillochloridaceae bacterium umkhey_bin13]